MTTGDGGSAKPDAPASWIDVRAYRAVGGPHDKRKTHILQKKVRGQCIGRKRWSGRGAVVKGQRPKKASGTNKKMKKNEGTKANTPQEKLRTPT